MDLSIFAQLKDLFAIIHVMSAVVAMGAAVVTDMLFTWFASNRKLSNFELSIIKFLIKVVVAGLVGILLSGVFLMFSDLDRYLVSTKFLVKMTIVVVLCFNGYFLHHFVFRHINQDGFLGNSKRAKYRRVGFALGAVSFVSWFASLSLGILDSVPFSYIMTFGIYVCTVICGVIVSQIAEKLMFGGKYK